MTRPKKTRGGANEGIQINGGNITADVLAVGENARANKTILSGTDHTSLLQAIALLNDELDKLKLSATDREQLKQHAAEIQQAVSSEKPVPAKAASALMRFTEKLKQVGVAVNDVAGMVSPIKTIAGFLHVSLTALGLML